MIHSAAQWLAENHDIVIVAEAILFCVMVGGLVWIIAGMTNDR